MSDQSKYTSKLVNTRVLIIGGSSGIGFSAAEASIEQGATVIISSSNPQRVDEAISALSSSYPSKKPNISGHACNLGDSSSLESNISVLFSAATDNGSKKLDHVIFTAGDRLAIRPLAEASLDNIMQAGTVRFFAPLLMAKHAVKHLNPGPASSIILTTGAVSERPNKDWSVVASFATGLHGMTRGLALDLAPIRVNLISPGAVDTALWNHFEEGQRKSMFEAVAGSLPTGRVGRPEDVAEAYIYCMRDQNVTGSVISTNGGSLLK